MSTFLRLLNVRILFSLSFAVAAFLILGTASASAASLYTVTDATATVGVDATLEIEYTVDVTDQTWAGGDSLTITLPANFPDWDTMTFTAENDADVTNDATNETAIAGGAGNGEYTMSGRVLTVKWSIAAWGAVVDDAETIRVLITAGDIPKYVDATSTVTFGGTTAAVDTNPTGTDDINISVGALTSVSFTPASAANSTLTDYTIAFTTVGTTMDNGAKLVIVFPTGYDLTSVTTGAPPATVSGVDGSWLIARSGQTLTLTQTGGATTAPGAKSMLITQIRNPEAVGTTGTFSITTTTGTDDNIQTHTSATASITTGTTPTVDLDEVSNIDLANTEEGVLITWDDPSDDDTSSIQILRGVDPQVVSGSVYASVALGTEQYLDTAVEEGDIVTYVLRTTDGSSYGEQSDEISITVGSSESTDDDGTDDDGTDDSTDDDGTDDTTDDSTDDDSTDDDGTEDDSGDDDSSSFTDTESHWAADEIEVMVEAGVVEGNPDGSFNPDGNLNRAEAAALLWRVLGVDLTDAGEDPFEDVDMGEWYADYIAGLKGLMLVDGNPNGTYEPGEEMNRAEFLQLALNVYLYLNADMETASDELMAGAATEAYVDLDTAEWYEDAVTVATAWEFVSGSECEGGMCFNASSSITRAEATKILYNMFAEIL
ncbi:MAG: S-layer homology domain-containing protein [Candidatus Gracilibacteria bacterium]|jgi:hypothetical protein